jgi:putative ABC transport system substrate-binding protein
MGGELTAKRLGLLHELIPAAKYIAVLYNPTDSTTDPVIKELSAAAAQIGLRVETFTATTVNDIDTAFSSMAEKSVDGLFVTQEVLFNTRRVQLATLATRYALPAIYSQREIVEVGGLMSYAASLTEQFRQIGIYTGRILKGDRPADLPVLRPTEFNLVINLQTARALRLAVPPTLFARADEVIE